MRAEMLQFLGNELQISDANKPSTTIRNINDAKELAAKLQIYLQELEDETIFSALEKFHSSLSHLDFPEMNSMESEKPFGEKYSSIRWHPKNWKSHFAIGFSFDERFAKLYYGIRDFSVDNQDAPKNNELQKRLTELFIQNDPNAAWPLGIWRRKYRIDSEFIAEIEDGRLKSDFRTIIDNILEKTQGVTELHIN